MLPAFQPTTRKALWEQFVPTHKPSVRVVFMSCAAGGFDRHTRKDGATARTWIPKLSRQDPSDYDRSKSGDYSHSSATSRAETSLLPCNSRPAACRNTLHLRNGSHSTRPDSFPRISSHRQAMQPVFPGGQRP